MTRTLIYFFMFEIRKRYNCYPKWIWCVFLIKIQFSTRIYKRPSFFNFKFVLFSLDIRFSTSTFVLLHLDIRFSTLTFVLFRRYGRELVLTLSMVFQVQHSCYSILDIRFSDQHSFFQPQHSFLKFNILFIAMFPVTSRLGYVGLFISVVGKDTSSLDVSY